MNQIPLVSVVQPFSRLLNHVGSLLYGQPTLGPHQSPEIGARHVLDNQVMHVAILSRIKSADQIRMIQFRLRTNFTAKVYDRFGGGFVKREDFDRRLATQHLMDRFKDLPHTALPDPVGDDVGAQVQLGATGKQLVRLVRGKIVQLDQHGRQFFVGVFSRNRAGRFRFQLHRLRNGVSQLVFCYQTTGYCRLSKCLRFAQETKAGEGHRNWKLLKGRTVNYGSNHNEKRPIFQYFGGSH